MAFTIKYSEQAMIGGKPPVRYELIDLNKEQARKALMFLMVPTPGTLIKWVIYENGAVVGKGDNREVK